MNYLPYWLFTSGENGVHGLDWGVKFSSPRLGDSEKIDVRYRNLLKTFDLPPRLKNPGDSIGLLLLPFDVDEFIAGFIFSGTDHEGRENTASVIAVIPGEISQRLSPNEALNLIWQQNNIPEISRKNSQDRPEYLSINPDSASKSNSPCFTKNFSWPKMDKGCIEVQGVLTELTRILEVQEHKPEISKQPAPKSSGKFFIMLAVGIILIAGAYFMLKPAEEIISNSQDSKIQAHEDLKPAKPESRDKLPVSKVKTQKPASEQKDSISNEYEFLKPEPVIEQKLSLFERIRKENPKMREFFDAKALYKVEYFQSRLDLPKLPQKLVDKQKIVSNLENFFANITPYSKSNEDLKYKFDKELDKKTEVRWDNEKSKIFEQGIITPEILHLEISPNYAGVKRELDELQDKNGWLALYFKSEFKGVDLAAFINLDDISSRAILRLNSENENFEPVRYDFDSHEFFRTDNITLSSTALDLRITFKGAKDFKSFVDNTIKKSKGSM